MFALIETAKLHIFFRTCLSIIFFVLLHLVVS